MRAGARLVGWSGESPACKLQQRPKSQGGGVKKLLKAHVFDLFKYFFTPISLIKSKACCVNTLRSEWGEGPPSTGRGQRMPVIAMNMMWPSPRTPGSEARQILGLLGLGCPPSFPWPWAPMRGRSWRASPLPGDTTSCSSPTALSVRYQLQYIYILIIYFLFHFLYRKNACGSSALFTT